MADERRDPDDARLDALRGAWRELEPPRAGDALDDADPRTRATVAWLQSAWSRLEAPAPVLPRRAPPRTAPRWLLPLAAAAGVLVALGSWLALQRLAPGARPEGMRTAQEPTTTPDDVKVAALAPDRVELRSGPVRFVLLTPASAPTSTETPDH